jgi:hypothetical protein
MNGWVWTQQKSLESVHRLQCTFLVCSHVFTWATPLWDRFRAVDSDVLIALRHGAIVYIRFGCRTKDAAESPTSALVPADNPQST